MHKSLEEIGNGIKPRWAVVNATVRYWFANGMKFSEEDDRYAGRAPKALRGAYSALGGKSGVIKNLDKESGIILLRLLDPTTPVDELPLYVGTEDKTCKAVLRKRLKAAA